MNRLNEYNFATVLSVPYYQGLKGGPFDEARLPPM